MKVIKYKQMTHLKLCLPIIFNFLFGISCQSQESNQENLQTLPLDPTVNYGKLDNGFTYYLKRNKNPEEKVILSLIVKAGYINEDKDQLQYAHLLEHLVAKQTRSYPNVSEYFSNAGGFKNAYTTGTYTFYKATIPSSDKKILNESLQIFKEFAQGNEWSKESIATERAAVQGEMRTSDPHRRWRKLNREKELFQNSRNRIFNEQEHIENLQQYNHQALRRFYEDWYRPDLQAAVIVGDINVDSLEYEIIDLFSDLKNPPVPLPKQQIERIDEILNNKNQFSIVTDSIGSGIQLEIIRKRPNFELKAKTEDDYKDMLLQQLYENVLREKQKMFEVQYDSPFEYFDPNFKIDHYPGRYLKTSLMRLQLREGNLQELNSSFRRGLIAWKQLHVGIQENDLIQAKKRVSQYYKDQRRNNSFLAQRLLKHFTDGKVAPGPHMEAKVASKILAEIKLKDLHKFIKKYGDFSRNTHYIFYKGKNKDLPESEILKKWVEEVEKMPVEPLNKPNPTIKSLADVANIPKNETMVRAELSKNLIGVSTIIFPNDVKVMLKPSNPVSDQFVNSISIKAFRPIPAPLNKKREYLLGQISPEVIQYSGAGSYNKFELESFMDDNNIYLHLYADAEYQHINGEANEGNLTEFLNLLYLYFYQHRKDAKAFKAWKENKSKELKGMGLRGSTEFIMDKIETVWYPELPVLKIQDLRRIEMKEVFRAAKDNFSDIGGFTFIITGDFDKDKVSKILINTLSKFPAHKKENLTRKKLIFPLEPMKENLEYKNTNQVYARLFFPVKAKRTIKTQIELQLLSMALHERIFERLRNGCYAPSARGHWVNTDTYAFEIVFDSAPGNEDKLLQYAIEEFEELQRNGVDQKWLDIAIKKELNSYEARFSNFGYFNFWPNYLERKTVFKEDIVQEVLKYGTILEHFINLEDINNAAQQFMTQENYQEFLGYPENYKDSNNLIFNN